MINSEEFRSKVTRYCIMPVNDQDAVDVYLQPNFTVQLSKKKCEEVRDLFIEGMSQIPNIEKGLSYIKMAGYDKFWLNQGEALICQAIGKLLEIWEIFPPETMPELFAVDSIGMFPMNTGLTVLS